MADPFVPPDFVMPESLEIDDLHLEPLGPEHNERDHAAWMSSIDHIHATPGFDPSEREWPIEMSSEQNLQDMEMHARHFEERAGFTYSILDGHDVVGCLYIYPSTGPGFDADVRSWVTESRAERDVAVRQTVSAWLATSWPFTRPHYDTRARGG